MSIFKGNLETKTGNNTSDILYPKTSIDQVVGLPVPTSADSGKYLGVDSNGNFALISGTPSGYEVTFNLFVGVSDMSGQTLKVKKDNAPTSENDYDYIVVTARNPTPTTNTLPSGSVSVNSLYVWCTNNSVGMKTGGYGWNSGTFSDTKAISGATYSDALQIDFTEAINGYTFNGDIYFRMKFNDM